MSKERAARRLLTGFKDLIQFIEEVEELGRVETAMKAAEERREIAEKEAADLSAKAKAAAEKAKKTEANAQAEHDRLIGEAKAEADRLVADAKKRANATLRDASEEARQKAQQAQAEIDALRQSFAKKREEYAAWMAEAERERVEKEKRIAALNKQIERIREKVT